MGRAAARRGPPFRCGHAQRSPLASSPVTRIRERRRPGHEIDPEDVIAGRVSPGARDLIALIHEVNPTGIGLTERETSRRYAQKRRLQSLLIGRFREDLSVEASVDDAVVTIRHRYLGVDACHAVLDELDEEARSWARLQLDTGTADRDRDEAPLRRRYRPRGSARADEGDAPTVGDLLAVGQRALDEYDFEGARQAFGEAHGAAPGDVRPVLALLALLVDTLALDEDALAFGEQLDELHLETPKVRQLLALAAARTRDTARAERLVRRLEDDLAAEVHRALCAAALDQGQLEAAGKSFDAAKRAAPASPGLFEVERLLRQARTAAVADKEASLGALEAAGDEAASVALARDVLKVDPENGAAREVLKRASKKARAAEESEAVGRIEAALTAGDLDRARTELARAREAGVPVDAIERHATAVAAGEAELRARRSADRIEAAVRAFGGASERGDLERALRAYLALAPEERRQVRARSPRPELEWLAADSADGVGARSDRLVSAVIAIVDAEEALRRGDAAGAAATLESHAAVDGLKAGRALIERVRAALATDRRARAQANLERASNLFGARDVAGAEKLIATLQASDLDDHGRQTLRALGAEIAAERTLQEDRRLADELCSTGDLLGARRRLERLRAGATGTSEEAPLAAEIAAIDERLRCDWVVLDHQVEPGRRAVAAAELSPLAPRSSDTVRVGLRPGGGEAVLASSDERFLFARFVDVDAGELSRLLIVRTPEPMGEAELTVAGGSLWAIGDRGAVLELSLSDGLPRTWADLGRFLASGEVCEATVVVPGARVVWVGTDRRSEGWGSRIQILDVDEQRVLRTFEKTFIHELVVGSSPPLVARRALREGARVYATRGAAVADVAVPAGHHALGVAVHPSRRGFLSLSFDEDAGEQSMVVVATDETGAERSRVSVPGYGEVPWSLVTDVNAALTYLFYGSAETNDECLAILADEGGRLVIRSEGLITDCPVILQDEGAAATVCLRATPRGRELVRLQGAAPAFTEPAVPRIPMPRFEPDRWCAPVAHDRGEHDVELQDTLARQYGATPDAERPAWARSTLQRLANSSPGLLLLLRTVDGPGMFDVAEEIVAAAEAVAPNDDCVALARVELEQREGRWTGDPLLGGAAGDVREHLLHLKGLFLFEERRYDEAREAWASAPSSRCPLAPLVELAGALSRIERGETQTTAQPGLAALVAAVVGADELLAAGDPAGARAILDVSWIRDRREEQSLARLVAAYLDASPPRDPSERFRMASALAAFVQDFAQANRFIVRMTLGDRAWERGRIEALVARAAAWLRDL